MGEKNYYFSLDLFRGFCGYGVAISHFFAFTYDNTYMEYVSLIFPEFFFLLSGFVLYPQLVKILGKKNNLFIFYKRRWLRTLPLFIVVVILVSALTNNLFSTDFYKYFFLIQKTFPDFLNTDYYPVAWSLSIEEFFYLLFPLILIFNNHLNFIRNVILIFLFIMFIKIFIADLVDANFYRTGTFLRFDAILLGFILAHYKNNILYYKKTLLIFFLALSSIFLLSYDFFVLGQDQAIKKFLFIILIQSISALIMFNFLLLEPILNNHKVKKYSLLISQQTYSIYLIHMIFIYIFKEININIIFSCVLYILLLFFSSSLIYKHFEDPILKLRPKL